MFMFSLNTTVITLNPKREKERISTMPWILDKDLSTGYVINCSTSCAASVGARVITCTWLLVTSGNASTGSLVALHKPQTISASVITPMMSLFFILK